MPIILFEDRKHPFILLFHYFVFLNDGEIFCLELLLNFESNFERDFILKKAHCLLFQDSC